jgi:ribosomal protein S6
MGTRKLYEAVSFVMRSYQLVLLLKSDLKKDQKEKLFDDVKKSLGKSKDSKINPLGERKLSFPIRRERKGEYVSLTFETDKVDEDFNKRLLIRDEILRHLLVRVK